MSSKNNNNAIDHDDDLYKVSENDKRLGLTALEPLAGSLSLIIVHFGNQPIKVDLYQKDWASKLKTDAKDCEISKQAVSAALKKLNLIESKTLSNVANQDREQYLRLQEELLGGNVPSLASPKETNSEKLVKLIEEGSGHEFFLDQHNHAFIITKDATSGAKEPLDLMDEDFIEYATGIFWDKYKQVINRPDVKNAASILAYKAKRNIDPNTGEVVRRPLYVRCAWSNEKQHDTIYIDACDSQRHIYVITKGQGFKIITQNEIEPIFRRQHRAALPLPSNDWDEDTLNEFLDLYKMVPREENRPRRILSTGLVGVRLIPLIPHPIELPFGSKGALKSAWVEANKLLIDPSVNLTQRLPENEDDFSLQGYNNYLLVYDNVKRKNVPKWFPDALCRNVYQEGSEKRQHYTNMKTVAFSSSGCAIVAGINNMFEEEDLRDRCVPTEWRRLKKGTYLSVEDAKKAFEEMWPKVLGYLYHKVSKALAIYESVKAELKASLTRMADFMIWAECFCRVCGYQPYEFVKAYQHSLDMQNVEIVQDSLFGKVFVSFVNLQYRAFFERRRMYGKVVENVNPENKVIVVFEKSLSELNKQLDALAALPPFEIETKKDRDWPKATNSKSAEIRSIQSNLFDGFGIDIETYPDYSGKITGRRNRMVIKITKDPNIAPVEDIDDADAPPRTGGEGGGESGDSGGGSSNNGGRKSKGKGSKSPASTENTASSDEKVLSNASLQSLQSLYVSEKSTGRYKDRKDGKDTFDKTIMASQVVLQELPHGLEKPSPLPTLMDKFKLCVAFDAEWHPETDEWYEAAFTDTQRNRVVLHIADFGGSEKALIQAIVDKLNAYQGGIVLGWWSRGKLRFGKNYNQKQRRKKPGDLIRLHEKCLLYGIESPIALTSSYDMWPTMKDRTTVFIDLHSMFDMRLVKDTIFRRAYQSTKLDEVYTALYPNDPLGGKLEGITSGDQVATIFHDSIEVQRAYVQRDADMTLRLAEVREGQLLGVFLEIAREIDLSFEEVCHGSLPKWWKRIFDNMGYSKPSIDPDTGQPYFWEPKKRNEKAYSGGLNLEFKAGLYYMLKVLDVASLYPFMAMLYNLSFDRVCCECCKDDPVAKVPKEVLVDAEGKLLQQQHGPKYWICQKQGDGAFTAKIRELWKKRAEYKEKWKQAKVDNEELAKIYDVKQLAYKILMNGGYGCFGDKYFHYRDMRISELITSYGRYTLRQIYSLAKESKKYGFEITSGDTDSIFLLNNNGDDSLVQEFIKECKERFHVILEDDRTYVKILLAVNKNYVGLLANSSKLDIKGMVGNKRSMPEWGREIFRGVIYDFFGKLGVIEDPRPKIKQAIEALDSGVVSLDKLKKWERLDMDPAEYKNANDPKKVYGLRDDLEEDDKIWYYLADKRRTHGNVSFTQDPAQINLSKYKEYLYTAVEPFLKALGDSEKDIATLLGIKKLPKKKKKEKKGRGRSAAAASTTITEDREQEEVLGFDN